MPKASVEDDPTYIPNVVYATPMKLKPSNVLLGVLAGAVIIAVGVIGAYIIINWFQPGDSKKSTVTTSNATSATNTSTSSAKKDETASWKTYENKEYGYSLKYPKGWYESTETKVVSEENNIVYHFYAVSKNKNQTLNARDEVIVIRYLEGDPCAGMEIKKSETTVSGLQGERSDCYEDSQLKTIVISFSDTSREEWFIVGYVDKGPDLVERIISGVEFTD
jgi:hypothetical protein